MDKFFAVQRKFWARFPALVNTPIKLIGMIGGPITVAAQFL